MAEDATIDKTGCRILLKDGRTYLRGDRKDIPPDVWRQWSDDYIRKNFGVSKKELEEKEKMLQEKTNETEDNKNVSIVQPTKIDDYTEIERHEEELIIEEFKGRILNSFVYIYPIKDPNTGRVVDEKYYLTYVGIKTIIQRMGNVSIEDIVVKETDNTYVVKAIVRNIKNNVQVIGISEQSKTMRLKDGTVCRDEYALQKSVSKAIRNAYRLLIPEPVAQAIIDEWLKIKNIKNKDNK